MNDVIIRKANIFELDSIIEMGYELHQVEKKLEPLLTFTKEESEKKYKAQLDNPNALFLVAEREEELVGYLYAHIDNVDYFAGNPKRCEIEVIYIKESARRLGISKKLIDKCIDWSKKMGVSIFTAGIYAENLASKGLFESAGFVPYHTTYILNESD